MKEILNNPIILYIIIPLTVGILGTVIGGLILIFIGFFSRRVKDLLNLPYRVSNIEKEQSRQKSIIQMIKEGLIAKGIIKPVISSSSPKAITERGHEILNKHSVNDWLEKECDIVKENDSFKMIDELDIYIKCTEWIKKKGERKVAEILYETNLSKEDCQELLALAIRDKILKKIKV